MRARLGGIERSWGLCRSCCAYVYDGDPRLGRWLEVSPPAMAGCECEVIVTARNPYGTPLRGRAVGVLKHFELGRTAPGTVADVAFGPDEERAVAMKLRIPRDFRAGTYHLSACLMLGARFNHYRAQVTVASGSA